MISSRLSRITTSKQRLTQLVQHQHQNHPRRSFFETKGKTTTTTSSFLIENNYLDVNHELCDTQKPLVALESTIITHGMPYPKNVEMALDVENEIRAHGAQPVTIGFLNGKLKAGLSRDEIELLAKNKHQAIKISRRDLPFILSGRSDRPLFGGKKKTKSTNLFKFQL